MDGKALRVRQTLIFEDAHGNELAKIQERMLRIKDSMEVGQGEQLAMVKVTGYGQEGPDHAATRSLGGQDQEAGLTWR